MNQPSGERRAWIVIAVSFALVAGYAVRQWRENGRLRHQLDELGRHAAALAELRKQNAQLRFARTDEATRSNSDDWQAAALRERAGMLRLQLTVLQAPVPPNPAAPRDLQPGMIAPETLRNEGAALPGAALKTFYWARTRGDVDTLLAVTTLDAEAAAAALRLFASLPASEQASMGSPERMIAGVMAFQAGEPGNLAPFQIVA